MANTKAFSELKTQDARDKRIAAQKAYLKKYNLREGLVRLWSGFDNGETVSKKNGKTYHTFGFYGKSFDEDYNAKSHSIKMMIQVTPKSKNAIENLVKLVGDVRAAGRHGLVVSANWHESEGNAPKILQAAFPVDQSKFAKKSAPAADERQF